MDQRSYETALRRASKRFAHAVRQLAEADSEKARKRHARRAANAQRHVKDAQWAFDRVAYAMDGDQ
jgi:hypothetical protein